jgi:hypothetical protein
VAVAVVAVAAVAVVLAVLVASRLLGQRIQKTLMRFRAVILLAAFAMTNFSF